jgi:nucleotide-binding universal stress UspA family protein
MPVLVVKKKPHYPYKRLLVATDFSDCSRAALITALHMFPDAVLHLVHAFHVPFEGWLDSQEARGEWRDMAQQEMDEFLAHPDLDDGSRERMQPLLAYGSVQMEIFKAIKKLEPDLLVLGTHGRGGVVRATIGSQASDMLSSMPVDTLMVRRR